MAVLVCIPINNVRGFPFLCTSPAFIVCRLFDSSHSDQCEMAPHCGFDLHEMFLKIICELHLINMLKPIKKMYVGLKVPKSLFFNFFNNLKNIWNILNANY